MRLRISKDDANGQIRGFKYCRILFLFFFNNVFMFKYFKKKVVAVWHLAITSHMRSDIPGDFMFLRIINLLIHCHAHKKE